MTSMRIYVLLDGSLYEDGGPIAVFDHLATAIKEAPARAVEIVAFELGVLNSEEVVRENYDGKGWVIPR